MESYLKAIREGEETGQAEINLLFAKASKQERERKRQEMERKIDEETAAAEEAIRAKYAKEFPAEWNESASDKALRSLARSLRN